MDNNTENAGVTGVAEAATETVTPEYAIEVKDVVIRYRSFKKVSIKKNFFKLGRNETEYFTAVDHVSFNVPKGQIIGIIGSNGSGKSTLLRAIAGIYSPDEGLIDTHGNTISLLALGVGFEKKLTGRENIILSGMLMGYSEAEVKRRMKEIIDFADIGEFIDKPVSTYSSGMHSKLAFAITSTLETDIILVDEVLSVGDVVFRKKSYERMLELIEDENHTVVIVSHNLGTLTKLCNTVVWIEKGKLKELGPAGEVVEHYNEFMKLKAQKLKEKKKKARIKAKRKAKKLQMQAEALENQEG